jgi:hypothetical protein
VRLEGSGQKECFNGLIRSRTRDLQTCRVVHRRSPLLSTPQNFSVSGTESRSDVCKLRSTSERVLLRLPFATRQQLSLRVLSLQLTPDMSPY